MTGEEDEVMRAASNLVYMKQKDISEEEASRLDELIRNSCSTDIATHDNDYQASVVVPPVVECLKEKSGTCYGPFEKKLTKSDAKEQLGRLIVRSDDAGNYISPLLPGGAVDGDGIAVRVYDGQGKEFNMQFKKWGDKVYVFNGGWNKFRKHHDVNAGDSVRIWTFKHAVTGRVCFVMIPRKAQA